MALNKAMIIGNLGQDPELRYTQKGTAVATLSVATNRKWKDGQGNPQEETQWHRVVVWDRQAESCEKYLSKGRQVFVEGRLKTRKWQDESGNDRYTTEIVAQRVQFLSGGSQGGGGGHDHHGGGGSAPAYNPSFDQSFDDDDIPF